MSIPTAKAPSAPGSTAPKGPTGGAASVYPALSGKTAVSGATSKSDPWRTGANQTVGQKPNAPRDSSAPIKKAKELPGNQGAKNAHTKPGKIKPVGSDAALRKIATPNSTSALQKVGGNKLGDKKGASNASKLYPKLPRSGQ